MAEAPTRPCRFFCHQCSVEISPRLPDFTCPRCDSGFIEELAEGRSTENGSPSTSSSSDQSRSAFETFDHGCPQRTTERLKTGEKGKWHHVSDTVRGNQGVGMFLEDRNYPAASKWHHSTYSHGKHWGGTMGYATFQSNGLRLGCQWAGFYHYTDRERIKGLPTIRITEEHVGAGLECPVCKDDYSVEERVRQLPCNHLFHNECIVPWLEQHDTCPVCRKSLSGQNTATDPPGLSGMNFSPPSSSSSSSSSSPSNENAASNS
ncbi:E3 ubiquitin-protein ligase RNF126-like isoform X3 [Scophthalmus maximus]|uniref:E3 ubiquitin-protein ligase RNF126-like isoform X3 n=1 Tax=Scophthalmus maximus TaxID=52904 RepID=UPI001FA89DCD|nr:E3 ubiquitin-protein ligase RNF126-like isoform X3 [Scophthalmus maximus]